MLLAQDMSESGYSQQKFNTLYFSIIFPPNGHLHISTNQQVLLYFVKLLYHCNPIIPHCIFNVYSTARSHLCVRRVSTPLQELEILQQFFPSSYQKKNNNPHTLLERVFESRDIITNPINPFHSFIQAPPLLFEIKQRSVCLISAKVNFETPIPFSCSNLYSFVHELRSSHYSLAIRFA